MKIPSLQKIERQTEAYSEWLARYRFPKTEEERRLDAIWLAASSAALQFERRNQFYSFGIPSRDRETYARLLLDLERARSAALVLAYTRLNACVAAQNEFRADLLRKRDAIRNYLLSQPKTK